MSFYQLPHPWDPRYAIPDYVMAEPPERGTFTTQWLPRGTISGMEPDFMARPGRSLLGRNDAGLAGLGTLEGGTLGKRDRGQAYTLVPLGGTAATAQGVARVRDYGNRLATHLISSVKSVPPPQRAALMKRVMDKIDPTMHARASRAADALAKRGLAPAAALHAGIAQAAIDGLHAEVEHLGRGGSARRSSLTSRLYRTPRAGRTRGMTALEGNYYSELGASAASLIGATHVSTSSTGVSPVSASALQAGKTGAAYNGPIWFNQIGQVYDPVGVDPTTAMPGGVTFGDQYESTANAKFIQVAGFLLPVNPQPYVSDGSLTGWDAVQVIERPVFSPVTLPIGSLTADQQATIITAVAKTDGSDASDAGGHNLRRLRAFATALPDKIDSGFVGGPQQEAPKKQAGNGVSSGGTSFSEFTYLPPKPIVAFTNPIDSKTRMGLYLVITPQNSAKAWNSVANPYVLAVICAPTDAVSLYYASDWIWDEVWAAIKVVTAVIVEVAEVIAETAADLTCGLFGNSGVEAASLSAAVTMPSGPTAALAAGTLVAGALCPKPVTAAPAVVPDTMMTEIMPILIYGGIGLGLVYFLKNRKKRSPTP